MAGMVPPASSMSDFQRLLYIIRKIEFNGDRPTKLWMAKTEAGGVERLTVHTQAGVVFVGKFPFAEAQEDGFVHAIEFIADNRIAERQQCGANLVQPSGVRFGFD